MGVALDGMKALSDCLNICAVSLPVNSATFLSLLNGEDSNLAFGVVIFISAWSLIRYISISMVTFPREKTPPLSKPVNLPSITSELDASASATGSASSATWLAILFFYQFIAQGVYFRSYTKANFQDGQINCDAHL